MTTPRSRNLPGKPRSESAQKPQDRVTSLASRAILRTVIALGLPATLIAVWWFGSAGSTDFYRPALSRILLAFRETWFGPRLLDDVLPSVARLFAGYALALVLGV